MNPSMDSMDSMDGIYPIPSLVLRGLDHVKNASEIFSQGAKMQSQASSKAPGKTRRSAALPRGTRWNSPIRMVI